MAHTASLPCSCHSLILDDVLVQSVVTAVSDDPELEDKDVTTVPDEEPKASDAFTGKWMEWQPQYDHLKLLTINRM
ncbi:hypothetical protein J6590_040843 [Homalodisca vitripennis]|nr:hypothetical protein J6590_040843 [Homalodisca vitripennis]